MLENRKDWPKIERRIRELRADGAGMLKRRELADSCHQCGNGVAETFPLWD
jgi:hypothetical protein